MQSAYISQFMRRLAIPRWAARWRARSGGAMAGKAAELNADSDAALAAVMLGDTCRAVRLERHAGSARLHLTQAGQGGPEQLRVWQAAGWFKGASVVLVLGSGERQFLTMDRPELPPEEQALAARYPLAEAMDTDAELLLSTTTPMPQTNDALRPQMLAVAARLGPVRDKLAQLTAAGIRVRHIDIADSALRGMVLLNGQPDDGCVALSLVGGDICIGLIWQHQFCALRSLALPARIANDEADFEEHLALHIQRTADHFERQATRLSVRSVLANMPALAESAQRAVLAALPLPAHTFDLATVLDVDDEAAQACAGHNDLTALAAVAAARLLEPLAQQVAERAEQAEAAAREALLATGYEPLGLAPLSTGPAAGAASAASPQTLSQSVIGQAAVGSRAAAQGPAGNRPGSNNSNNNGGAAGPFDTHEDSRSGPPTMTLEDRP